MTRLADEHRHLAPEDRARTVLATADRVEVTVGEHSDTHHGSISFLAHGSEIFLVMSRSWEVEQTAVRMLCRGPVPGLGALELLGRCDSPLTAAELPALLPFLVRRGHHLHAAAQIVPVELEEVRVLLPGTRRCGAQVVHVPVSRFEAAQPDTWVAATQTLGHHLEECHQEQLVALAARHLDRRPEAVVLRSLGSDALRLSCLLADGVTDLTVGYGRPMAEAGEVAAWLRQATGS